MIRRLSGKPMIVKELITALEELNKLLGHQETPIFVYDAHGELATPSPHELVATDEDAPRVQALGLKKGDKIILL